LSRDPYRVMLLSGTMVAAFCYLRTPVVDGVDGPLRHQVCQNEVVVNLRQGSRP
jgi:hypothetical protein